jgi:nucleoside-diphosphate-sugar epimerase
LLSAQALTALPDVANVVFMAGRKFGSQGSEWLTWAMNAHVPALIAQRYKNSRIVAFSTACVYPFVDVHGPGAPESLAPTPPGEYANSCVARERMFEHFSHEHQTSGCLLRLSYAIDMRYGVLHDVARTIWQGQPLSVAMGYANIIWQGDANDLALRALNACTAPTSAINLSGPPISIRDVATRLAARMGKTVHLTDTEAPSAWLVDCRKADALWGPPSVALDTLLDWTAAWVMQGHKSLDKPTHFEVRDGHY